MKKFYHVSIPVYAHVPVMVEADSEAHAEEIASHVALLSDAEAIDFANAAPDITEVDKSVFLGKKVWFSKKTQRLVGEK